MPAVQPPAPDLYAALDFRAWLRAWFAWKKQVQPRYSHRLFARRASLSSPSHLLQVIEGRRVLTAAHIDGFCRALGLEGADAAHFGALVELAQGETPEARNRAWRQVSATRRFREAARIDGAGFEYLSRWIFPAVRELATCPGFRAEPGWIAAHLEPRVEVEEAAAALRLLRDLGMLRDGPRGLEVVDVTLTTPHEVGALATYNYHSQMLERAQDALRAVPPAERHFGALTVAVPAALLPELKRELVAFQERILDLCDGAEGPRERVYQVNLQVLPLSRRIPPPEDP